uniref:Uncharacterized protein n=1 Tax=Salmo trutta TaxID=8032 RepID=A0A674ARU3_SALTR
MNQRNLVVYIRATCLFSQCVLYFIIIINPILFFSSVLILTETNSSPAIAMDQRNLQDEFKDQFTDVVSRLQSKQLFQSDWDIASFAVFFIFIGRNTHTHTHKLLSILILSGMVLLLVVLVLIRCCCCCCCDEQVM